MTMANSEGWIVTRCRVSLAGRVTAAGGGIVSGGVLSLTAAKGAAEDRTRPPAPDRSRRYDARIRPDGFYFFLDLPAGDYVLDGRDERGNDIEAKQVSIPPAEGSGPLPVVGVDLSASTKSGADQRPPEAAPAAPARRQRAPRAR